MDKSDEFGMTKGLGLVKGNVKKLPIISKTKENLKIPNIGWFKLN